MSTSDFESDQQFKRMIGTFLNGMITEHGFSFEEAYAVVHGEIKREYDQRVRDRRAGLRLVETPSCEAELNAKSENESLLEEAPPAETVRFYAAARCAKPGAEK